MKKRSNVAGTNKTSEKIRTECRGGCCGANIMFDGRCCHNCYWSETRKYGYDLYCNYHKEETRPSAECYHFSWK